MFDLTSFIRQLLPPHRRNPLTVALFQVLFGPAQFVLAALVGTRQQLFDQIQTTGQILVLEDLLTRAVASQTNSSVYITEGNDINVDFTVIVPPAVPPASYGLLVGLIDRYKQTGKRYKLAAGLEFKNNDNQPLSWERGYPYLSGTSIFLAVNKPGTYYVNVKDQDGKIYADGSLPFRTGSAIEVANVDPTLTYTVSVGTITASIKGAVKFLEGQAGYDWNVANGRMLFLAFNANEQPDVTLTKPDGSVVSLSAIQFGVNFANHDYNYRTNLSGLPNGRYLLKATVSTASYTGYFTLSDTNSGQGLVTNGVPPIDNQTPVINRQVARQTAKVGTAYSQTIPGDTFKDNDGSIASVSIAGLPAGLTSQISGLVIVISGTPTTAGDVTVSVTATDNKGATVTMQYVIAVAAIDIVPPPPPDPGLPPLQGIFKVDLRPASYEFVNIVLVRYDSSTGQVFVRDASTRTPADYGQGNRQWRYLVNGKFYTQSEFNSSSWPARFPIFGSKFLVDTNLPVYQWRDQPTQNDNFKFRYI